jgi:hypothetical protein
MVLITDLERLLGREYGCYGYAKMTKFLTIRIVLCCRLYTDVQLFSPCAAKSGDRDFFAKDCTRLENITRDTFSLYGWQHNVRLDHQLYHRRSTIARD